MNSNSTSSASSSTSNRPPFHISRASDEITQFPSYETMHQLSTSPNHKSFQSTSTSLFILSNHQNNSIQTSLSNSTNDSIEQTTVTRRVSGAIDFFTSFVPSLSSPRSNHHPQHHTPSTHHVIHNSDQEEGRTDPYDRTHHQNPPDQDTDDQTIDSKLSKTQFLTLTLNLLSCNLIWTILIFYGIPFILKLNISNFSKTLLWLSSPISALFIPTLIGMISDLNYKSLYRRRNWIIITTTSLLISLISLSFCQPLGMFLNYLIGGDQGDWDPKKNINIHSNSILISIISFYFAFFSLDGLFLSTRSLILDQISSFHQNYINIWSSRMLLFGQLIGFGIVTFSNSNHGPNEPQLLRELIGYGILLLILSSSLICLTQIEHPITSKPSTRPTTSFNLPSFKELLKFYKTFLISLPIPIKRVCYVQIFNSICWITILYHSKSLISNLILYELTLTGTNLTENLIRYSERQGTITMLKFSLVSLIFSFILPFLCKFGTTDYVIKQRGESWTKYRRMLRFLTPRNLWSFSFIVYLILIGFTFKIESSNGISQLIILLGFSWSITQWVPFALLMEYTRSIEETPPINQFNQNPISSPSGIRRISIPSPPVLNGSQKVENRMIDERSQLIQNHINEIPLNLIKPIHLISIKTGGSILAIHQLSTVIPNFLISIITSMMFNIVNLSTKTNEDLMTLETTNPIIIKKPIESIWFFRFTSIFALISLILSRKIVLPTSELEYWDELNYQIYETQRFRNGEVLQEDLD